MVYVVFCLTPYKVLTIPLPAMFSRSARVVLPFGVVRKDRFDSAFDALHSVVA